jgi:DNA invertase Pin-like site-specific DNA recombinase
LTAAQAEEIRRLKGTDAAEVAETFGVVRTTVYGIWNRRTWADHPAPRPGVAHGERNGAHRHPEKILRGSRVGTAKLTEDIIRSIRRAYDTGEKSQKELATEYGISPQLLNGVVRRKTWRHVE